MADKTSGTPEQDDRDAQETATAGTPGTDDADADKPEETPEEKIARLEAFREKSLAEKSENEKRARENEELKRRLAEAEERARASTPPTQGVDPLEQEIAELMEQAKAYPNDATVRRALKNALQEQHEIKRQSIILAAEPEFQAMPEAYRDKARNAWLQGRAMRPVDALLLVKGEAVGDFDPAAERRRAEADRAAAAKLASTPATTAGGSVTTSREQNRRMAASEYYKRLASGDQKLLEDADAGRVEIDHSR